MQAKDIKPNVWYATKEKYRYPDLVMLPGVDRYTIDGITHFGATKDTRVIAHTPDRSISGMGHWTRTATAYLAVQLYGPARETVENWILHDEGEREAHAVMTEGATLLTKVVNLIAERGKVEMAEIDQVENRERGIVVKLIEGREIVGEYAEIVTRQYENEQAAKQRQKATQDAAEARRLVMVDILDRAAQVGINTDRHKGGAEDLYNTYSPYTRVEMSVETFAAVVEEIERLRALVRAVLHADESSEDSTGAGR